VRLSQALAAAEERAAAAAAALLEEEEETAAAKAAGTKKKKGKRKGGKAAAAQEQGRLSALYPSNTSDDTQVRLKCSMSVMLRSNRCYIRLGYGSSVINLRHFFLNLLHMTVEHMSAIDVGGVVGYALPGRGCHAFLLGPATGGGKGGRKHAFSGSSSPWPLHRCSRWIATRTFKRPE
jgi:hypothetical protein